MTIRHLVATTLAGALALTACTQSPRGFVPERVVETRTTQDPAARGPSLLKSAMLEGHNAARAAVSEPPLTWNDGLAANALAYAETMAKTRRFEHAPQPQDRSREGENLWTGTRYAYAYREMIGHWVAEQRDFVNGPTPQFSRTGQWEDVAHYTQIVWRKTTQVGCAMASSKTDDYLVCRYSPPGNVIGEQAY